MARWELQTESRVEVFKVLTIALSLSRCSPKASIAMFSTSCGDSRRSSPQCACGWTKIKLLGRGRSRP